jgi:tetratricopeptide (TPR) repeat protein
MFVQAKTHAEIDVLRWLALLIVAGALALLLVGTAMGTDGVRPPGLLPPDAPTTPLPYPSSDQPQLESLRDPFGLAAELWKAIELQQSGNIDAAIATWEVIRLPHETEHWRLLMLGVAHMQNGNMPKALDALDDSKWRMPDNPLVYYALGLAALQQADVADEWYDALELDPFRLANYSPERVPMTRSMYRLAATMAFERAIELARYVDLDQTLLPAAWVLPEGNSHSVALMVPRVRDAVAVFHGERFEGRSHLGLALLHMERGGLKHSELHLDKAADLGEATGEEFRELAEQYETEGCSADAMRANLKAFAHGGGVASLQDAWHSFGKAMMGR